MSSSVTSLIFVLQFSHMKVVGIPREISIMYILCLLLCIVQMFSEVKTAYQ